METGCLVSIEKKGRSSCAFSQIVVISDLFFPIQSRSKHSRQRYVSVFIAFVKVVICLMLGRPAELRFGPIDLCRFFCIIRTRLNIWCIHPAMFFSVLKLRDSVIAGSFWSSAFRKLNVTWIEMPICVETNFDLIQAYIAGMMQPTLICCRPLPANISHAAFGP